ncbi:acetyl-CoA hydrolase/transferase C-terminal domain-containing protein [Martelella sp. AMO21009]
MPAHISPDALGRYLPDSGLCWIGACSGESDAFREGLSRLSRPGLRFTSIFVPGLNRPSYLLETGATVVSFFMLPELMGQARVDFLPLPYREILHWLDRNPPSTMLVMVAPPDAEGNCSFGAVTDFAADLWQGCETIIAHVNPLMPATRGTRGIPYDRLSAVIEAPQTPGTQDPGSDAVAEAIARHAATVIPDGATLQAGIGRVPETVLRGLTGKRGLAIHSGLIGDSTLHLLQSGALRAENPITAGVAIGTRALYGALPGPEFNFRPPSHTHDLRVIAGIDNFITINSAIEVDLEGQVHAEATPKGPISGPGGASDFAAGARGSGGLRLVALPSTAGGGRVSRIVKSQDATGPASLGRFDTDIVITEHGLADLRGLSPDARRAALIALAAPEHRIALNS